MESYEWGPLLIIGFLIGVFITLSGALGIIGITGGFATEPQECPICQSGNSCIFQQKEASFEKSGKDRNKKGLLGGNAKLTNTIRNSGDSKALFNLHAKCKTISVEKDVFTSWAYIAPGESKKFIAGMDTGLGEDWECWFVEVQSIDIEGSCNLITT